MPTYRLRTGKFYIDADGSRLKNRGTIEISKEEFKARNLSTHFEIVGGGDEEDRDSGDHGATGTGGTHRGGTGDTSENKSVSTTTDSSDSKFSAISGMSVEEVVNLIDSLETEEDLELLRREELANKKRKGVISAIDAALED